MSRTPSLLVAYLSVSCVLVTQTEWCTNLDCAACVCDDHCGCVLSSNRFLVECLQGVSRLT
eukprot:822299-Prorocentrum_minimum.AAC.2